jgi:hypothetical protein
MKCTVIKKSLKSIFGKRLSSICQQYKKYGLDWHSTIRCNERKRILTFDHLLMVDDLKAPLTDQDFDYLCAVTQLIEDVNEALEGNGLDVRMYEQLTRVHLNATINA